MNEQKPQDDDALLSRVQMLEQMVANLSAQVAQAQSPLRPYFFAKLTDGAKTFQERIPIDGEWEDLEDGRVCDDEEHETAAMDMEADGVLMVAVRDGDVMRHVKLSMPTSFPARITAAWTASGYDWEEIYIPSGGTVPLALTDGRTSTTTEKKAFHIYGFQGAYQPTPSGTQGNKSYTVLMHEGTDPESGETVYWFGEDIGNTCIVAISGGYTGGGKYTGTMRRSRSIDSSSYAAEIPVDTSTNLGASGSAEGTGSVAISCVIYNPAEYNLPTHRLVGTGAQQWYAVGYILGYSTTLSLPVVLLSGQSRPNHNAQHNLSGDPTWSWNRDALTTGVAKGGDTHGAQFHVVTNINFTAQTFETRTIRTDADGRIILIGPE